MIKLLAKLVCEGMVLACAACADSSIAVDRIGFHDLRLSASSTSVQAGEAVSLSWQTGGPPAYLSGVGPVDAQGTAVLKPRFTTTYSLLTDYSAASKDITIEVTGVKGEDDLFPRREEYRSHQQRNTMADSLTIYLGALRNRLQDKFRFSLYDYSRNNTVYFITHLSESSVLLPPKGEGVATQWISFMITVTQISEKNCFRSAASSSPLNSRQRPQSKKHHPVCLNVDVASRIKYQLLSEEAKRNLNNDDVHAVKSLDLLSDITHMD